MTPEQVEARRSAARLRYHAARRQMPPEQVDARQSADRVRAHAARRQMSPAQVEGVRSAARVRYHAARRRAEINERPAVASQLLRATREWLCPPVDVPRVWTSEDERKAAKDIADAVEANVPDVDSMCAVCARLRLPDDVVCLPVQGIPNLHLLSADGDATPELPRAALTTVDCGTPHGFTSPSLPTPAGALCPRP